MNKGPISELIAALMSGKYKQGYHRLIWDDSPHCRYCVLGVACQLYAEHVQRDDVGFRPHRYGNPRFHVGQMDTSHCLPPEVKEWYGLSYEQAAELINLNDGGTYSFRDLAALLGGWLDEEARPDESSNTNSG